MATERIDPTFQPGWFVFGSAMTGSAYFGRHRSGNQFAVFGIRSFGTQIPGKVQEEDFARFLLGAPLPDHPNRRPITPMMSIRASGTWARRAIFRVYRGSQSVRRYSPSTGLQRENLVPSMLKLMEAAFLWSIMTDETKARCAADAKRTRLASQANNYFNKLYITDDPRWLDYV